MKKKLLIGCIAWMLFAPTFADKYSAEINLGYAKNDLRSAPDITSYFVQQTIYADFINSTFGIDYGKGAFAEASFLSRGSSFSLARDNSYLDGTGIEAQTSSGAVRLVVGNGSIIEFSVLDNPNIYSVGFGAYFSENADILVSLTRAEGPIDSNQVSIQSHIYQQLNSVSLAYDVLVGWITADELQSSGMSNMSVGTSENSISAVIEGGVTFYAGRNFGLGVNAGWTDAFGIDTFTYSANAEFFITPRFAIDFGYFSNEIGRGIGQLSETLSVSLTGRI